MDAHVKYAICAALTTIVLWVVVYVAFRLAALAWYRTKREHNHQTLRDLEKEEALWQRKGFNTEEKNAQPSQ